MKLDTDGLDGLLCPPRGRVSRPNQRGGVGKEDGKNSGSRQGGVVGREPLLQKRASMPSASPARPRIPAVASDPSARPKGNVSTAPKATVTQGAIAPKRPSPMPPSMLSRGKTLAYIPAINAGTPSSAAPRLPVAKTITTPSPRIHPKQLETAPPANMEETIGRDIAKTVSSPTAPPLEEVSVAVDLEPESLGVSSNLGLTQRGRPVVMSTVPPLSVPKRDTMLDTVSSVSPDDITEPRAREGGTRRRFNPVLSAAGVLIAFAAAFFGRAFLNQRDEKRSSTQTAVEADRDERLGDKAAPIVSATPSMTFETQDEAEQDETARAAVVASPIDETARASAVDAATPEEISNAIRFPGRYQKGETQPDIAYWGEVDRVFQSIRKCKKEILILGYTCDLGDEETNRLVSEKRAEIVARFFIERGFKKNKLVVQGMGASRPIMDNETEEGRMRNRRVEILCR